MDRAHVVLSNRSTGNSARRDWEAIAAEAIDGLRHIGTQRQKRASGCRVCRARQGTLHITDTTGTVHAHDSEMKTRDCCTAQYLASSRIRTECAAALHAASKSPQR